MSYKSLIIEKMEVELEIDTKDYIMGYIKGFIEGFKKGSRADKSKNHEISFITKITLENGAISEFDYCEVIKGDKK